MRAAPAVSVRCTGGWPWRLLNLLLPALAAGVLAAWAFLQRESQALPVLGMSVLGVSVLVLLVSWPWSRPQARWLQWDGQCWAADGEQGRLQLMVDLGFLLLLRLHDQRGGVRWLAVTPTDAGPAWHALRAAVYARPSEPGSGARSGRPERAAD